MIISPRRRFFELNIKELIRYRDLIFLLVQRDFVVQYKQTVLGPIWYVASPLISTIMYTFVFGRLANIGTDGIPFTLFYYSGTMLWTFFSSCFTDASNVFVENAGLFGKVYFPRLTVPISKVFTHGLKIGIQFVMLACFFVYYRVKGFPVYITWAFLLSPLLLLWIAAIGTGAGIIISSLTTKYRDLRQLVSFALGLAMYATPVVYPLSQIPERFQWVAYANPVCAPIELFRLWFFGMSSVTVPMILTSLGITALLLIFGLSLFNQTGQNFIDII